MRMTMDRRRFVFGSMCFAGGLGAAAAAADTYPSRPIKVVVTDPAGAAVDVITRIFTERLSVLLGQPLIVENRAGATGLIAAQTTVNSAPDGYTLLAAAASTFTVMPVQNEKAGMGVYRELVPVAFFGQLPQIVAVSAQTDIRSLAQLIAAAQKEPGRIICGTNGSGTLPHLTAQRIVNEAKAPMTIVPYTTGGTSAVLSDILGGRVHVAVSSLSALQGLVQSGHLRVVAVASRTRLPNFPDWPTAMETVPGFTAMGWSALLAPARTPQPVLKVLNDNMRAIGQEPAVVRRLQELGTYPIPMTLAEIAEFIAAEQMIWWPIVKAAM